MTPAPAPQIPRPVVIPCAGASLKGDLVVPRGAKGLIVFAHGSGSGRLSPRNRYVAGVLQEAGLATLLLDLLTESEEEIDDRTARLRFDVAFLADRLQRCVYWQKRNAATRHLPVGYFGASTGAAAALIAAARRPNGIFAVVSRGGRPDLAGDWLTRVRAPTLLIVGGADTEVLGLNLKAERLLAGERALRIVPGATHLFEERGALEEAARLAAEWFVAHVAGSSPEEAESTHAEDLRGETP